MVSSVVAMGGEMYNQSRYGRKNREAMQSNETIGPAGAMSQQQGLPPTGLQQQLGSLQNTYNAVRNARLGQMGMGGQHDAIIGYDVREDQFRKSQLDGQTSLQAQDAGASTSLDALARNLATQYGLPIGRGRIVDESGNMLMTPDQLAEASGGNLTLGESAAKLGYISQAVTRRQNEQQQKKGLAAIQSGMGQIQSNARGSLAAIQSGMYQDMADLYANQEYEAADFSYFIQKEQDDIKLALEHRARKELRGQARQTFVTGLAESIVHAYSGNWVGAIGGLTKAGATAESTGWF